LFCNSWLFDHLGADSNLFLYFVFVGYWVYGSFRVLLQFSDERSAFLSSETDIYLGSEKLWFLMPSTFFASLLKLIFVLLLVTDIL